MNHLFIYCTFYNHLASCNEADVHTNCSIAVKGRKHNNMAIDKYVESIVVKPTKEYLKKHTTLNMLQKINLNLELFKHIRHVYMKFFNVH